MILRDDLSNNGKNLVNQNMQGIFKPYFVRGPGFFLWKTKQIKPAEQWRPNVHISRHPFYSRPHLQSVPSPQALAALGADQWEQRCRQNRPIRAQDGLPSFSTPATRLTPARQLGHCKASEWRGRPGEEKEWKGVKIGKSEAWKRVKSENVVPSGYGGASEQADAASGPVPKHPGP